MILNSETLASATNSFNTLFNRGFNGVESHHATVAMVIPSTTREETYGWLQDQAPIREWIGPRMVTTLSAHGFKIVNRKFEKTLGVPREDFEDDKIGLLGPAFEKMGYDTKIFPDQQVFDLLRQGFDMNCFDGQKFFDADHPVGIPGINAPVSLSNVQAGAGPAWYLIDGSQPLKPIIYQQRIPFRFQALDQDNDENVFRNDEFLYGVRGRSNVGFGLWQLAFASKDDLDTENYEAARVAMQELKNDAGKPLGIKPTHLIVPPALEGNGRRLLKALNPDGGTNEWADSTKLIVTPWLI